MSHSLRSGRHVSPRDKAGLAKGLEPHGDSPHVPHLFMGWFMVSLSVRTLSFVKDRNLIKTSLNKRE